MAEPDMDARKRAEAIAEELIATYGAFASNAALPRGEHPGEECSRMFTACITSAIEAAVAQEREAAHRFASALVSAFDQGELEAHTIANCTGDDTCECKRAADINAAAKYLGLS